MAEESKRESARYIAMREEQVRQSERELADIHRRQKEQEETNAKLVARV
eukprot:CAMPEP_0204384784 /NCGR_PEP_ID=MMETSP0469-20131031/57166_1 /ASSEMBLY_ACC=CAM_ASM_000384 /TAXON_ID=2969 /ORGANISM="Oxyrrhis marina" /LENGTH=48 /DNA_ID= /DNA_START= /DNA_END= /DNA_ORIENTATION=